MSKIHLIVRFDTWNIRIQLFDPISGGRAVMQAVQKAIINDQSFVEIKQSTLLAVFGRFCMGVLWRGFDRKVPIFGP